MTNLARFYSRKKVHIILDLNDRAVCHVFVSKGARYYIIKWAEYHRWCLSNVEISEEMDFLNVMVLV